METLESEPDQPATASVIWMHGLGADAKDFYGVPVELGLPPDLHVRYVFPNAPQIPVTINRGMVMRAWYDIDDMGSRGQDEKGIRRSAVQIDELVQRENERGIPTNRIVLAGFSQGGALALFAGVRTPQPLAGIMCLSGYMLLEDTLSAEANRDGRGVPIFQAHGTDDPVVPHLLGRGSRDLLTESGYTVEWHDYPMGHSVCIEEVRDIGAWLTRALAHSVDEMT